MIIDKDFIFRVLNISELLGYIFVVGYLANYCENCSYRDGDILLFLLFVALLRICSNYIFQLKLIDLSVVFAAKKAWAKIKLVVSSI
jgi:hypothetical protein